MLGENHSLLHEFPQFEAAIYNLYQIDRKFASDSEKYHQLDNEIRKLEMKEAPVGDAMLHQMKFKRAVLKDRLYNQLLKTTSH